MATPSAPGTLATAPLRAEAFVGRLEAAGFDVFTGVPCSLIEDVIAVLERHPRLPYVAAPREDLAVGLAGGAWLGGRRPVVLMQNSGLGTSLNTLISLNMIYRQPCILLVSWRGQGGKDAPEHLVMGEVMPQFLDTMKIPHRTLTEKTVMDDFKWVADTIMKQRIPLALFITKGVVKGIHP